MKRILFIITCLLLLTLAGCGLPQKVKSEEKQVLQIAQNIPLPVFYNTNNGHLMVHKSVRIRVTDYDSNNGEPYFEISVMYYDSHWFSNWDFGANRTKYYLYQTHIPVTKELLNSNDSTWGYITSSPTSGFINYLTCKINQILLSGNDDKNLT